MWDDMGLVYPAWENSYAKYLTDKLFLCFGDSMVLHGYGGWIPPFPPDEASNSNV